MDDEERALLSRILLEATQQMLAAEGKASVVVGDRMRPAELLGTIVASIGLASPNGLRGKLVIVARPEFFRSIYPPEITAGEISDHDIADWASEVANQLLGRIKNLLGRHAVDFSIGIPAVVGGERLRLLYRERAKSLEHSVRVDGRQLDLLLEMERVDGRKILEADGEKVPAAAEGSSLLF